MLHISQEDRLKIIKDRINQYNIRFPVATLNRITKEDMGNISKMLKGKKAITDKVFTSFTEMYPEKVTTSAHSKKDEDLLNQQLPLGNVNITLADYIDLLKTTNERLFNIVSSTLNRIHGDTQTSLAYQKAWVKYDAERSAAGDKQIEAELRYKMSRLVDDELKNDAGYDNPDEIDNPGKAE